MIRDNIPNTIRGVAALAEALDTIGAQESNGDQKGDHAIAKIIVENEMPLRDLMRYALDQLAAER